MKCPQCRGVIERDTALCPHCGASRSGKLPIMKPAAKLPLPGRPSTSREPDLSVTITAAFRSLWRFMMRDTQTKIGSAMAAGAIIGAIIPGVNWVIGGLVGGFFAYRLLERTK
ncbi:MAG: hypothetical protein ABI395_12845 [Sphingobium sp.]